MRLFVFIAGVGAGHSSVGGSSGGGHGGNGGQGQGQPQAGGAHDSFLYPTKFGNNGGHALFPHRAGIGGGRIYLRINHTLTVDGFLVALGGDWGSVASGGGSGGTIHIETYTIDGSGQIDASGGAGYDGSFAPDGGGGGGGRMTLYYMYNFYVGKWTNGRDFLWNNVNAFIKFDLFRYYVKVLPLNYYKIPWFSTICINIFNDKAINTPVLTNCHFSGEFKNHGGSSGSNSEPGGPGTVYIHHLPELVNGAVPAGFVDNRTLYLNNIGYEPIDKYRNLTETYGYYPNASGVAWIWPGTYPPLVTVANPGINTDEDITLDYLKVNSFANNILVLLLLVKIEKVRWNSRSMQQLNVCVTIQK